MFVFYKSVSYLTYEALVFTKYNYNTRYSFLTTLKYALVMYDTQVSLYLLSVLHFSFQCHIALYLNKKLVIQTLHVYGHGSGIYLRNREKVRD